jgi:hypothetical protein
MVAFLLAVIDQLEEGSEVSQPFFSIFLLMLNTRGVQNLSHRTSLTLSKPNFLHLSPL